MPNYNNVFFICVKRVNKWYHLHKSSELCIENASKHETPNESSYQPFDSVETFSIIFRYVCSTICTKIFQCCFKVFMYFSLLFVFCCFHSLFIEMERSIWDFRNRFTIGCRSVVNVHIRFVHLKIETHASQRICWVGLICNVFG